MIDEELRLDFERALVRELSFLTGMAYTFSGVQQKATGALGPYLEGTSTNAAVNRDVRVVYAPANGAPRSVAITSVVLIVSAPVDEFDYTTTDGMSAYVTDLSALDGGLISRLEEHLRTSARVLQAQFAEVLTGRAWQPDQLDWCGMK